MSKKQIIIIAIIALADACVLALGAAILLTGSRAAEPVPTPFVLEAAALSSTPLPPGAAGALASPTGETPTPTETHWPTWTPRPTRTSFPSNTPTPTQTPTNTSTPTPTPSRTPRMTSTPKPAEGGGSGGSGGGGGGGGAPSGVIRCGTPNGRPANGKLDVLFAVIGWREVPDNKDRAIGKLEILASGGGDCYKYNFIGKDYDYEPIEFEMNKCGSQTVELIVTAADGQRWKYNWILAADDPNFNCK